MCVSCLFLSSMTVNPWWVVPTRCQKKACATKPFERQNIVWTVLRSSQCSCFSSAQGLQLTGHSCWGLMTKCCKSQQRGHFLSSAGLGLIGSGTAILTAYLIANWKISAVKCESKHADSWKFGQGRDMFKMLWRLDIWTFLAFLRSNKHD